MQCLSFCILRMPRSKAKSMEIRLKCPKSRQNVHYVRVLDTHGLQRTYTANEAIYACMLIPYTQCIHNSLTSRVLQGLWKIGGCPPQGQNFAGAAPPHNFVLLAFFGGCPRIMTSASGVPSCNFCLRAHFACFCINECCRITLLEKARSSHLLQAISFVQPTN